MDKLQRALQLIENRQLERAREVLEELLNEQPANTDVLYNLGMLYTELGRPAEALQTLSKCIEYGHDTSNVHVAIGYAHSKLGNYSKAEEFFINALEIDKNNSYALRNLGSIYGREGDFVRGLDCFEFDYVGVIFGDDLLYDFDAQGWRGNAGRSADSVVKRSREKFVDLVKNTYRVLLSRGMKGCYVYFIHKDTERFFRSRMETAEQVAQQVKPTVVDLFRDGRKIIPVQLQADVEDAGKFKEYLPVFSLRAAAGKFGESLDVQEEGWLKVNIGRKLNNKMFVAKVIGSSMEPRIPSDSYCVFSADVVGSRQGKIVLVQHHEISDSDTGGSFTVKEYWSKKKIELDGTWAHEKIVLQPLNKAYDPIPFSEGSGDDIKVIAEFVAVLEV